MNVAIIILCSCVVGLTAITIYCLKQCSKLSKELEAHRKEIESLKRIASYSLTSINDLTEMLSSKTFNVFPLIGQKGDA
jgi:hypothetical protein